MGNSVKLAPAPIPIAYNHTSFQEKFGMLRQKKIVDQYSELVINKKIASWTSYTDQPTAKLPRTSYTCGNPRTMLIIWGVSAGPYQGQCRFFMSFGLIISCPWAKEGPMFLFLSKNAGELRIIILKRWKRGEIPANTKHSQNTPTHTNKQKIEKPQETDAPMSNLKTTLN